MSEQQHDSHLSIVQSLYNAMLGVNGVDPYERTMLEVNCVIKGQFHKGITIKPVLSGHSK